MVDLIVVGGGYWGAAICWEARRLGWSVVVIDDADPMAGSRAASGICDPSAYKSATFRRYWPCTWEDSELEESLNWLLQVPGAYQVTEWFWNQFQHRSPREGSQCIYLSHPSDLLAKAFPRRKMKVVAGTAENVVAIGSLEAKRLVVAAGYRTDEVLEKLGLPTLGVGRLYGRGLIGEGMPVGPTPVSVMIRPYCKHTLREWKSSDGKLRWKVGDTAERNPNGEPPSTLIQVANGAMRGWKTLEMSSGYRPTLDKFTVEKIRSNVVVATGGHRLALGLSGLVAKKVLEMLR